MACSSDEWQTFVEECNIEELYIFDNDKEVIFFMILIRSPIYRSKLIVKKVEIFILGIDQFNSK